MQDRCVTENGSNVYTTALPFYFAESMTITINEDIRAYIDPLTEDEYLALERSLLSEGCRDALVLWGDVLVDGHNRYGICQKHGIPFNTVQNQTFQSIDDVHLWMIDNHLGRRSVSDFQRGILALRKKDIVSARQTQAQAQQSPADTGGGVEVAPKTADGPPLTREAVARAARVSSATLGQIEKIQKTAAPELVSAVKAGVISINAAAAVASLPGEKQVAAVAGGKKELRQVARQVREARLPPKPEPAPPPGDATPDQLEIHRLTLLVAGLTEERDQLKKKVQHLTIALAEARDGQKALPRESLTGPGQSRPDTKLARLRKTASTPSLHTSEQFIVLALLSFLLKRH